MSSPYDIPVSVLRRQCGQDSPVSTPTVQPKGRYFSNADISRLVTEACVLINNSGEKLDASLYPFGNRGGDFVLCVVHRDYPEYYGLAEFVHALIMDVDLLTKYLVESGKDLLINMPFNVIVRARIKRGY